jgi:hypothetical protein
LDLLFNILDGVAGLGIKSDGLASQGLDEDLHAGATTQTKHQVKGGLLLDVVVGEGTTIFELLASKDETLLIRGDSFLVLNKIMITINNNNNNNVKKLRIRYS